jgi:folate-binding protein YgfZ
MNPLHQLHEQAEASFLPYGPNAQIVESYGEVELEYAAIRKGAALMDAPHRAVAILTGKDRLTFLHNKVTNDTAKLTPGQGCYAYLLNLKGRIVLDMNILHTEEATLVDLDVRLAPQFLEVMEKYIFTEDVRLLDGSQQLGRLTLIGPQAATLLARVITDPQPLDTLSEPLRHAQRQIGKSTVTIFRNDLCGEEQYELIVPRDQMMTLWQILHEAGNGHDGAPEDAPGSVHLKAIGWSAFNTARIEAGTPLHGIDITDNYLPMETGPWYLRAVAVTKGCYLGQEIVARMHAHQTVARLLVGLRVQGDRLPLAGTEIFDTRTPEGAAGPQVGIVTSSCFSPMLGNIPIALGYVKKAFATPGREVETLAEGSRSQTTVATLPLWKRA